MSESVRGCESNSCEYLIRNLFVLLLSSIASFILGFHCRRSDLIWPSVSSHDRTFQHMAPRRMAASNFETNAGKDNILALVGVFSGVSREYFTRRQAARKSWVPENEENIRVLQKKYGVVVRFVVGFTSDADEMSVLDDEEKLYGTMVRLKVREKYHNLVLKMRKYMIWAEHNYNFKYILKVDDDVYHNPQRLSWAVREWESEQADYIGCFLWGIKVSKPVTSKWFEPNAQLLGPNYFTYPAGPTYALSFKAVQRINFIPDGWLRFFGCGDDCSIGSWLLALNVTHKDDSRLCSKACDPSAITVRHGPGLSNPNVQLPLMHKDDNCRGEQQPPGQPPDVRGAVSFDFSNTNCYQLLEPWDTSFDLCLSNHYTRNMNNTRTS